MSAKQVREKELQRMTPHHPPSLSTTTTLRDKLAAVNLEIDESNERQTMIDTATNDLDTSIKNRHDTVLQWQSYREQMQLRNEAVVAGMETLIPTGENRCLITSGYDGYFLHHIFFLHHIWLRCDFRRCCLSC